MTVNRLIAEMPRGSGKTAVCLKSAIFGCENNDNYRVLIVTPYPNIYREYLYNCVGGPDTTIYVPNGGIVTSFKKTHSKIVVMEFNPVIERILDVSGNFISMSHMYFKYDEIYFDDVSPKSVEHWLNGDYYVILDSFTKKKWAIVYTEEKGR